MFAEEELLKKISNGDGQALAVLYDQYGKRVYAIARHLVGDERTCEEIVQDVFTRVWTTRTFRPQLGRFEHWIYVVTRRIAIDTLRRLNHSRGTVLTAPEHMVLADQSAVREMDARLLKADLVMAMATLRREERVVIEMAYFQGYTIAQTAEALGWPLGTVKTRLHHALRLLKVILDTTTAEVHP